MDEDKEKEEAEEPESDDLRELILQQLATLEASETSDDDSYKVRLSCILEDDESESSGAAQKEAGRRKESEKGPPEGMALSESETSDDAAAGERVQITDLDDVTPCERADEWGGGEGFAIKKLKSSENVHGRPFVLRRREPSSDSSDLDTSVTNSGEGHSSDVKIVEVTEEEDEEKTLNVTGEDYGVSEEEEETQDKMPVEEAKGMELERVDNEMLAPIFAKVSRTYLEKTKSNVKWEENEKIDFVFKELVEEVKKARATGQFPGEQISLQDVHIRGTSPRVYDPPVPPETYLWEELKRLRERGGYPWTYLDKPPFDEATWKKYMEHVYEPINPLPLTPETKPEAPRTRTPEIAETHAPQASTIPDPEKQFKRIPSRTSLSKKESVEESKTSEEEETQMENRCLASIPTAATETTAFKSDVASTAFDASEFESRPVRQESLVKTKREQMRARATEIQQRLRNHAGRIRNKFSNVKKPGRRERPKREAGEKRFKLPEMHAPKISLPDASKFKLPEMHAPKISLPDRSKFKLPEKAKLHLPDRSKFHLPERPNFGAIAQRVHLPERKKFHLPEKAKFHLPDKSKFHLPSRPKLELPRFRRFSGTDTSPRDEKSRFELKSYPKLFRKHSKDYMTSSPKQTRGRTPPPRMQQHQRPTFQTWTEKMEKLKYADDDLEGVKETDSGKSESPFEKEGYAEDAEGMPTVSTKSSMSEMSEERKKGVLEEINPDEFFLRQKGISQDDIDVGHYLSREIREAFRSPDVNALAKMDYDEENVDPGYQPRPSRPKRTGSTEKKSILKKSAASDPSISDDGYKTYPPRRPGRKSRSQSKSLLDEEAIIGEKSPGYEADVNLSRYDNVEDDEVSEYYKSPGVAKEYRHYEVPRSHAPVVPSPPVEEELQRAQHEDWQEEEEEREKMETEPPKPAARRKQKKKKKKMAEAESTGEEQPAQEVGVVSNVVEEPQPVESPVPPKRTRTRSSGSRSLRSFPTVSDINQSFQSEPARENPELLEEEVVLVDRLVATERSPPVASSPEFIPYEITDLDDPGFGYATVGKPTVSKPERKKKPERPPPPRRRKDVSVPVYNTYPRRAPIRPLRNYSTLGPSRPPRQKKVPPPIERTLSERQSKTYAELKSQFDDDDVESFKDLQTEKVIEKMKGRPLPPPPRPPRQKSKGPEEDADQTEEEKLSLSILKDEEFPIERKVQAFVHAPPPGSEAIEEVCVSTQTDPLPEDFSFGTEEGDELSHEQLRIQEAFLEEMKREEEETRQRRGEGDAVDAELKAEVIRQIEDIIAEEKRMLERKNEERMRRSDSRAVKEEKSYLEVEPDMGYASLDRRGHRQEPAPALESPTTKMDKLQVNELEVGTLNVHEVQSDQIFVKELQSNRIASHDIDNTGGTMSLGTVDVPPALIEQIVAKIPWDALRENRARQPEDWAAPPVRPQRRRRGSQQSSDEEAPQHWRRSQKRHHRSVRSTEESEGGGAAGGERSIPELSLELARACTSVSVQAMRGFVRANASIAQSMDRELCVQAILCVAVALIAGFFLFGFDAKIVHLHKWDFQFPPQPPSRDF